MLLPSTLLLIFSSATLVSGQLHPVVETSTEPRTVEPGEKRHQDRDQRSIGSLTDNPECQEGDPLGATYIGSVNITIGGRTCQNWAATEPHEPAWTDVGKVGETEPADHNFCRNAAGIRGGVWCYTTDPDKRAEHCFVPRCDATYDCQEIDDTRGVRYAGDLNVTTSGRTCKVWSDTKMAGVGEHNYCRNPDRTSGGPWCYTTDPDKYWEFCSIPRCGATYDCQKGDPLGVTYFGSVNVTANGRPCRSWSDSTLYSYEGEHNQCRNPSRDLRGVWCYVIIGSQNVKQEFCSVPKCDDTTGPQGNPTCQENTPWLGASYNGTVNVTMNGIPCKSWSQSGGLENHNFCRNPDMEPGGVWCYTTNPNKTWDYCPVPRCGVTYTCQNSTLEQGTGRQIIGESYAGFTNVTVSGRTCQAWSSSEPHNHNFIDVGNHNYCRNPKGQPDSAAQRDLFLRDAADGVWCYTTDPEKVWEFCAVPRCDSLLEVLDFSADNDNQRDEGDVFTLALLAKDEGWVTLGETFTICFAFMVEAWTDEAMAKIVTIQQCIATTCSQLDGEWGSIALDASFNTTQYQVDLGLDDANNPLISMAKQASTLFFPLHWTRVCLSVDSKVTLVVDGELLGEAEYKREEDVGRPKYLSLLLGVDRKTFKEYTGRITNLNVFNSSLPFGDMVSITRAGEGMCGAAGDLLSWETANWNLFSAAKKIEIDGEWEGPCRRESTVKVFASDTHQHCMHHCQKIVNGRSPSVRSNEEWSNFTKEVDQITAGHFPSNFLNVWLSATEGDQNNKLKTLSHWPETHTMEATESVWRDFYTGEKLWMNWTKPFYSNSEDKGLGETHNCMRAYIEMAKGSIPWDKSWHERKCLSSKDNSCPCSYPAQPVLRLRGLCPSSLIEHRFTPRQLPYNPGNMILVGQKSSRVEFNDPENEWVLRSSHHAVTASLVATKPSYAIGKHEWIIRNDFCKEGKSHKFTLKLTGCNPEGEFTCNDGQCIKMERRCDQMTNCRDESDEKGCQVIILKDGYNKKIPPTRKTKNESVIPAKVGISITLMKVVEIEEVDHSIHLQFQISLSWREIRVEYHNLKKQTFLNALTEEDIEGIWRPLIVYDNTDQKEVTRLGMDWEWATDVTVTREQEKPERSGIEEVDEAEIFEGAGNRLTMNQTYTWEFQCKYELQRYPFDTQVN